MVIYKIIKKIQYIIQCWIIRQEKKKLGYCGKRVKIVFPNTLNNKMFLYDDVYIYGGAKFIIGGGGQIYNETSCWSIPKSDGYYR